MSSDLAHLVGADVVKLRKQAGLSQGELARRIGMEPANLSRLESGRQCPSLETLFKIYRALRPVEGVAYLPNDEQGVSVSGQVVVDSLQHALSDKTNMEDAMEAFKTDPSYRNTVRLAGVLLRHAEGKR